MSARWSPARSKPSPSSCARTSCAGARPQRRWWAWATKPVSGRSSSTFSKTSRSTPPAAVGSASGRGATTARFGPTSRMTGWACRARSGSPYSRRSSESTVAICAARASGCTRPGGSWRPWAVASGSRPRATAEADSSLRSRRRPTWSRTRPAGRRPRSGARDHPAGLRAKASVAGLDHLVDEPEPLVERGEGALHGVDRQPLHLAQADRESFVECGELTRQRDVRHQAVVRVDRDPEAQPPQQVDRVLADRPGCTSVDVRRWAHLEGHAPVPDVGCQASKLDRAVRLNDDVVHDPHTVSQSLSPAELERLPDRRQPERLAGMDRDVEVLPAHVVVSIEIARRRVALLGTRHVEPDDSGIAPAHGALRDLDRTCRLAHGRHEGLHHDGMAGSGRALDTE